MEKREENERRGRQKRRKRGEGKTFEQKISTFLLLPWGGRGKKKKSRAPSWKISGLFRMLVSRRWKKGNRQARYDSPHESPKSSFSATRRQTRRFPRLRSLGLVPPAHGGEGGRGRAELEPNRSERWIFSLGTDYRRPTDIACRLGRPSTELYGEKDRPNARSWPDLRIRYPGVSLNLEHLFNRTVPNGRIKILLENVVSIPQDDLAVWFLSQ